jgi:hypothetical protein
MTQDIANSKPQPQQLDNKSQKVPVSQQVNQPIDLSKGISNK